MMMGRKADFTAAGPILGIKSPDPKPAFPGRFARAPVFSNVIPTSEASKRRWKFQFFKENVCFLFEEFPGISMEFHFSHVVSIIFSTFQPDVFSKTWLVRNAMFKETAAGSGLAQRNLEQEAQTQSNEDHHPWLLRWCFFSRVQTMSVGCWVAEFSSKLPMFEVGSFLRKDSSLHTKVQKEKNGLWHERGGFERCL